MKQFFLPVLGWTLAISQIFAQNPMPAAVQQPIMVKDLPGHAAARGSKALDRSNPRQLDSTVTYYNYTLQGAPDSTPLFRTVYEYPQSNVTIATDAQFNGTFWTPQSRSTETTDALGRVTHAITEVYDVNQGSWTPETKLRVHMRGNSLELIDSLTLHEWDENLSQWKLAYVVSNTYNAQNQLETAKTTFDADGQLTDLIAKYHYDANQDNDKIENFLVASGFWLPLGKQEMLYNNHLLIQKIQFSTNGLGGFVPSDRTTYFYNPEKLLSGMSLYTYVSGVNDWNQIQNERFEYDGEHRLTLREIITYELGAPHTKELATFAYDGDGNTAFRATALWNPNTDEYVLNDRQYYYYSGGSSAGIPTPMTVAPLSIAPNPTTGDIRLSLEHAATIHVLNSMGQLMQVHNIQPGETLDLGALPAGVYQLVARQDNTVYSGKVVRQ